MNFLVVIIISITILALGVALVYNFVGETEKLKGQLDASTEAEITNLLESGQRVALPFNSFKLKRGDDKTLGLGIINILEEQKSFLINITHSKSFKGSEDLSNQNADDWFLFNEIVSVNKEETKRETILLTVPNNAESGTHIFNVIVCEASTQGKCLQDYGKLKKIYITVP